MHAHEHTREDTTSSLFMALSAVGGQSPASGRRSKNTGEKTRVGSDVILIPGLCSRQRLFQQTRVRVLLMRRSLDRLHRDLRGAGFLIPWAGAGSAPPFCSYTTASLRCYPSGAAVIHSPAARLCSPSPLSSDHRFSPSNSLYFINYGT